MDPLQQEQLKTWADQRDTLLREISVAKTELEILTKRNIEAAAAHTEIENQITSKTGAIEVIKKNEEDRRVLVSKDLAKGLNELSELQGKVTGLLDTVGALEKRKNDLESMISTLSDLYEKVFAKGETLKDFVNYVTRVGADNIDQVNIMVSNLRQALSPAIDTLAEVHQKAEKTKKDLSESVQEAIRFNTTSKQEIETLIDLCKKFLEVNGVK